MGKPPQHTPEVKQPEDARVTPASGEAATGDGGRILGPLGGRCAGLSCPGCGCPAERCWWLELPARQCCPDCQCDRWRCIGAGGFVSLTGAQPIGETYGLLRHAEPEPVAVSPGARSAPVCEPPRARGGGAEGTQGGRAVVPALARYGATLRALADDWRWRQQQLGGLAPAADTLADCATELEELLELLESDELQRAARDGAL